MMDMILCLWQFEILYSDDIFMGEIETYIKPIRMVSFNSMCILYIIYMPIQVDGSTTIPVKSTTYQLKRSSKLRILQPDHFNHMDPV